MKKNLLTLLIVALLPFLAIGQDQTIKLQTFKLTPNGFLNSLDTTKTFIIIDVPGKNQQELYKKSLVYLSSLYVSPKNVLSQIENESITVNAVDKRAIKMKVMYLNPLWDINYTINFQFKDGRIKVSQPTINSMETYTGDMYRTASVNPGSGPNHKDIYNKKGELKQKDGKDGLENFVNTYLNNLTKALSTDSW